MKTSANDYATELPEPTDVLLLVEVAKTTLGRDRDVKGPLYARHGITEYWLVDVGAGAVIVERDGGAIPICPAGWSRRDPRYGNSAGCAHRGSGGVQVAGRVGLRFRRRKVGSSRRPLLAFE